MKGHREIELEEQEGKGRPLKGEGYGFGRLYRGHGFIVSRERNEKGLRVSLDERGGRDRVFLSLSRDTI